MTSQCLKKTETKLLSFVGPWSYLGVCAFMCVPYNWQTLYLYRLPQKQHISIPSAASCLSLPYSFFQLIEEDNTKTERVQLRSPMAATLDLHYYYNKPPSQAANIRRSSQENQGSSRQWDKIYRSDSVTVEKFLV